MRNSILFIIFLIIIFVLNIFFYIISEDYRSFLKDLKQTDEIVQQELIEKEQKQELEIEDSSKTIEINKNQSKIFDQENKVELKKEIVLWQNYQEVIDLFSYYNLTKLELNTILFDLTDEYPDSYLEYYWEELVLYLFPTRTYDEILNMFLVLQMELPFNVKEVGNFWEKSFYINLEEDIDDGYIRLVISNKWITFWLKIRKNEYNLIKEKLNWIKK